MRLTARQASPMARTTSTISAAVTESVRVRRTAVWASSRGMPSATSTCEGSSEPAGAGRAARAQDAAPLKLEQHRLAAGAGEAEGRVVREPMGAVAGEQGRGNSRKHAGDQLVAQIGEGSGARLAAFGGDREGTRKAYCPGHIFRTGAASSLLASAMQNRLGLHAAAQVKHADALGRAELMAGKRKGIDAEP